MIMKRAARVLGQVAAPRSLSRARRYISGKFQSRSLGDGSRAKTPDQMIFIFLPVEFCAAEERRNGAQVLMADDRTN